MNRFFDVIWNFVELGHARPGALEHPVCVPGPHPVVDDSELFAAQHVGADGCAVPFHAGLSIRAAGHLVRREQGATRGAMHSRPCPACGFS